MVVVVFRRMNSLPNMLRNAKRQVGRAMGVGHCANDKNLPMWTTLLMIVIMDQMMLMGRKWKLLLQTSRMWWRMKKKKKKSYSQITKNQSQATKENLQNQSMT